MADWRTIFSRLLINETCLSIRRVFNFSVFDSDVIVEKNLNIQKKKLQKKFFNEMNFINEIQRNLCIKIKKMNDSE